MITITIAPVTPAQVAAVTKLLQDYPVLTPLENFKTESPPPKTAPRASSAKSSAAPAPEAPTISLEQVRAKLSSLSQAGKKNEVAAMIAEFGASKLTEVKPEDYASLLAKAETL